MRVFDAALDEHAPGADRLGILGDERALLRERGAGGQDMIAVMRSVALFDVPFAVMS